MNCSQDIMYEIKIQVFLKVSFWRLFSLHVEIFYPTQKQSMVCPSPHWQHINPIMWHVAIIATRSMLVQSVFFITKTQFEVFR